MHTLENLSHHLYPETDLKYPETDFLRSKAEKGVIVNGGVIVAGLLVYALETRWPDLLVGAIVFTFVMQGAIKILKLSR